MDPQGNNWRPSNKDACEAAPPPGPKRALLRVAEVAARCGVSCRTVNRWLATEGLPHVRKAAAGTRPILFVRPEDLEEWIAADRHTSRSEPPDGHVVHLQGRRLVRAHRRRDRRA